MITKRNRPVARLVPPESADRERSTAAVEDIRRLRQRINWQGSVKEIMKFRDEGRR